MGALGKRASQNLVIVCLSSHSASYRGKYVLNSRVSMVRATEGRDDLPVSKEDVKKAFQAAAFESSILSVC